MTRIFLIAVQIVSYFNIAGLATTNIIRLTKGNSLPILSSKCVCDGCGEKIPPHLQIAIISFIACKGKCKKCGGKIPIYPLCLEIAVLIGMSAISALFNWSYIGVLISFSFYEMMRILFVIIRGKREKQFAKQYVIAVISMLPFLLFSLFVAFLLSCY